MARSMRRRDFLKTSGAAIGGYWVAGHTTPVMSQSPNEKVNVACIGVGGKGRTDSRDAAKYGNLVAICDIDSVRLDESAVKYPKARKFFDYRKLLDDMEKEIDAVVVSAPDHHHCAAGVRAMRMGKHLYCQKPLTHTVAEARLMRETAREHKVITQMGNQGTAADGFRAGVELIQSGAVGPIREVVVWTNRPFKYWKQAPDIVARPADMPAVPPHVHWDLFVGPAPMRPYHPAYHPHDWRGWWDFGTGSLGDMACHTSNLAFMGLKLGLPTHVSAVSGEINSETYPAWATITYEFPQRGELPPVKLTWYEGAKDGQRNLPQLSQLSGATLADSGMLLIGEKGAIYTPDDYGSDQILLPEEKYREFHRPDPTINRLGGDDRDDAHKREWIQAIQGGPPTMSNFDYAATLTEAMLLGNVAVRSGQAFDYDGEHGKITNSPQASALLDAPHRAGWEV
ncbi:MAG: Gfo/Idh/MocA family oxidoreductase [Planctomycetales bacterium]|nr:Gfo/Idh/MocA family oxidoreductase [Planctomycetales bacterium]MCA9168137.1 Gfo/Idh/MocA family oxidoreductase [Planctomycetales bacterium]